MLVFFRRRERTQVLQVFPFFFNSTLRKTVVDAAKAATNIFLGVYLFALARGSVQQTQEPGPSLFEALSRLYSQSRRHGCDLTIQGFFRSGRARARARARKRASSKQGWSVAQKARGKERILPKSRTVRANIPTKLLLWQANPGEASTEVSKRLRQS